MEQQTEGGSSPSASSGQAAHDERLQEHLAAKGALLNAVSGCRPCGLRGLFATADIGEEEMACWVPNESVLDLSTCDAGLREAISATLQEASLSEVERGVYERMMCLAAGLLLEREKGSASSFYLYIKSLPEPPPTVNIASPEERHVLGLMAGGSDFYAMYQPLVDLTWAAVRRATAAGLPEGAAAPDRPEVDAAFYFVLSRMSYMRMIPLVDLANAALPGQENARIVVDGQTHNGCAGCAVVTKRPVAKGEELLIDYNHHHAVGMLTAYGCTLGLEKTCTVTTIQFSVPQWLKELGAGNYARGVQLQEDEETGLEEQALLVLRMASMGNLQAVVEAVQDGYFKEPCAAPLDKRQKWDSSQRLVYIDLARFCAERRKHWEESIKPAMRNISSTSYAGEAITAQFDTEIRLLQRCEEAMLRKAAGMVSTGAGSVAKPEVSAAAS